MYIQHVTAWVFVIAWAIGLATLAVVATIDHLRHR
jgi:hypothetical protein